MEHNEQLTKVGLQLLTELSEDIAKCERLLNKESDGENRDFWHLKQSILEEARESLANQIVTGKFNC